MPKYLTIQEAQDLTRLAKQTLYRRVCERSMPFTKCGGKLLFPEDKLIAWMEHATFVPKNGKAAR